MKQTALLLLLFLPALAAGDVTLKDRQEMLGVALQKVQPALVAVKDNFGAGSGVVVSGDGLILTASHVVESRRRRSNQLQVVFPNGEKYNAELLGMNRSVDAAMLKITQKPLTGKEFPHAEMGESTKVERGDWCFALGHPGGFRSQRPAPVRLGRVLSSGYRTVVSDCAIVLGDSGGPLFDLNGRVIGIHSMITEVIVENRHVAIDCFHRDRDRMEAKQFWGRLKAHDTEVAESKFMGVDLRWRSFTPEVAQIVRNSPAEAAGLRSGDILLKIQDQPFADPLGLSNLLDELAEDQQVSVLVDRHGREVELKMKTGDRPSRNDTEDQRDRTVNDTREQLRELENQLTSLRQVGPYEKRSIEEMQRFEGVLAETPECIVEFRKYTQTKILGTIMSSDGYILTKASEVDNLDRTVCVLPSGKSLKPRKVAVDYAYDLLLVKVDAEGLQPVRWSDADAGTGRIVVTTDTRGTPLLPGVISVATRKLPTATKGFLGVEMKQLLNRLGESSGVEISRIFPGGAAQRFGVKKGDIVLDIDGERITRTSRMTQVVRSFPPFKEISLRVRRNEQIKTIEVVLTPRFIEDTGDVMLPRYSDPKNLGEFASTHNSGFPEALQHDTDLYPNQCGGPLFDITGNAVGLNIARAARITSYAIPASAVKKVYEEMKAKDSEAAERKEAS